MGNSTISRRMSGFGGPIACWRGPLPNWRIGRNGKNRARISIEEPGVASCRQARDNGMASTSQLNPYQCDQCGTTNIVAAPLLYRTGNAQLFGALPFRHEPILLCTSRSAARSSRVRTASPALGNTNMLHFLLGIRRVLEGFWNIRVPLYLGRTPSPFCCFSAWRALGGMLLRFRSIARYNREVYPRLYWNWEHTYICRRCGRSLIIPS